MSRRVLVAGAGAAGMCAAITAARAGASVILIEKNDIPGRKIAMTGNGRCNLTNTEMNSRCFNTAASDRMQKWLDRFGEEDTEELCLSLGIMIQDESGYIYPLSGQAVTVQNALISEVRRLGIRLVTGAQLKEITPPSDAEGSFTVRTTNGSYEADRVIVATGGLAGPKSTMSTGDGYYIAEKLGLHVTERHPALTALLSDDKDLPSEAGVRMMALVSIEENEDLREYGEIQLTGKGISGIPVLQLSGSVSQMLAAGSRVTASIDFLPDYDEQDRRMITDTIRDAAAGRTISEVMDGITNHYIAQMVLRRRGIDPDEPASEFVAVSEISVSNDGADAGIGGLNSGADTGRGCCDITELIDDLSHVRINITGCADYKQAQVTRGGVDIDDLTDNLEARTVPGLYFAGELTDVDGRCGGYNLQWAWTSGFITGSAAVEQ